MNPLLRLLPKSLLARVFALYSATLIFFVSSGLLFFYQFQFQSQIEDAQFSANMLAEVLHQSISDSAVVGDYDAIKRTLAKAIVHSHFSEAAFIDLKGGKVRETPPNNPASNPPEWLTQRVAANLYEVNRNISVGGRDYGVIRLEFSASDIAQELWKLGQIALTIAISGLGIGLLLLGILLKRWLGSLERMRRFELEIRSGAVSARQILAEDTPLEIRQTFDLLERSAASLQAQQAQAEVTLRAIGDGVITADADGKILYCNPAAYSMLGQSSDKLLNHPIAEIIPALFPEGAEGPLKAWSRKQVSIPKHLDVGEQELPTTQESLPIFPNAQNTVLDTALTPIRDSQRDIKGYVLACRDITEPHRLQQQVQHQLAEREQALDALRKLLADMEPSPLVQAEAPLQGIQQAPGHHRETDLVTTQQPPSNDLQTLSDKIRTLVSERERSRVDLNNQKFALDQHAIVSITDRQGTITYANDRFCSISGYAREELLGKNHRLLRSGVHPSALYEEMWREISEGRVWRGEVCNRAKNGTLYWVAATIVPLLGADGLPEEYIAIRTDITERKAAEIALQQAKDAAEMANRAKSDFLANMSHEIRTPMNGILGMTALMFDTPLSEEQREYISIVNSSAESLLTVINDILDFSKIEAGKLLIENIGFDLPKLITDTLRTLALRANEKQLELLCDVDINIPPLVRGDPGRLRQVLVNLIGNAIKFTPKGEVLVSAQLEEQQKERIILHLAVQDTGIGIPPDKQDMIFEAFAQEDSSTTRRYGGTGLGLSICRRLIELMGGQIWLESEVGRGSTFHFTLPLLSESTGLAAEAHAPELMGRQVLIVDDNAVNRQVLSRMLSRWHVQADTVSSANEAINTIAARQKKYDCILLDYQMPEIDGLQLAQILNQETYHDKVPPMIMLSSSAMRSEAEKSRSAGIAEFLTKPIATNELLAALYRVIGYPSPSADKDNSIDEDLRPTGEQTTLRVLLVEDNPVNQKLACNLLQKWGHRFEIAANGQEALDLLDMRDFDAILMDMQMPVMGGIAATEEIRRRELLHQSQRRPIIAMTANAMQGDREICLAAGMDDYIAKPIRAQELQNKLATITLARHRNNHTTSNGSVIPPAASPSAFSHTTPDASIGIHIAPCSTTFDYGRGLRENVDSEILEVIGDLFLGSWQDELNMLDSAISSNIQQEVASKAHRFKGTVSAFAAQPALELINAIEGLSRSTVAAETFQSSLPQIREHFSNLEREIILLVDAIKQLRPPSL